VGALVNAVSPLTCLLRGEVVDRLETERKSLNVDPEASGLAFVGLASDWKNLLFPSASDVVFADGYAQAVTFALLLARTEGIPLDTPPHQIGATLGGTHRRRDPAGKRTSPLDSLHVDAWPAEWSRELTDLLTVLTRLVDLEPVQADLLDRVLAGPLVSKQSLAKDGTAWPKVKADRRARHSAATGSTDGTLDLE
jgi:hypothetical protein